MIKAGQIDKGTGLLIKGAPFICVEREFVNPGKGSAFVRLKLKSPTTGQVLQETIKSQDSVEDINVIDHNYQYSYNDGEFFHMMDEESYEDVSVPMKNFPEYELIMKEGDTFRCTTYNDEILDIQVPSKVVYIVAEAEEAIKGDTVQGATKFVTTETGLRVRCPIFIKQGEKIRVNTETKEYLERVND